MSKLFPVPSGRNGYEEYVMACDTADRGKWSAYEQWLAYLQTRQKGVDPSADGDAPVMPARVSPNMTDLEVRKIMDELFGNAVHIMSEGNRKEVVTPHQNPTGSSLFPELASFKLLAKIDINRAHVEFSQGRTNLAVKDLLEGLKFSQKIFGNLRLSTLVSVACQAIVLSEFERSLGQLSLDDAKDIDKACKAMLAEPIPMTQILQTDFALQVSDLDNILDHPENAFYDPDSQSKADMFKNLNPADREQIKSLVTEGLRSKLNEEISRFSGPESGWLFKDQSADPVFSINDHTPSNLAAILTNALVGHDIERNYANALVKGRIQLKLLRLHAQVIEYKWQNYHLPSKLEDCAYDGAGFDPFARTPFHYQMTDGGYRLYSEGVPGIGRIELKYRAPSVPANSAPGTNAPPSRP